MSTFQEGLSCDKRQRARQLSTIFSNRLSQMCQASSPMSSLTSPSHPLGIAWLSAGSLAEPRDSLGICDRGVSLSGSYFESSPGVPGIARLMIVLALSLAIVTSYVSSFRRLNHIPGPRFAAFSRLWLVRVLGKGDSASKFVNVSKEYGRLQRFEDQRAEFLRA